MSFDGDNEDDDNNRGGYNRGYNSSSSSGHEQTSSFNTTMMSDDGRFLGIKLSPDLAKTLNVARGGIVDWASKKGEQYSIPLAEKIAKRFTQDEGKIFRIAGKTGNIVAYSIILSNEILNVGRNVYDTMDQLSNLRIAVKPLAKSGHRSSTSPLSGDNEVVANARAKINGVFWHRLANTATGSIAILPTLIGRWHKRSTENLQREKERQYAKADSTEKLADLIEKDLELGGEHALGTVEQTRKANELIIERLHEKYQAKYDHYILEGKAAAKGRLQTDLEALTANPEGAMDSLTKHGISIQDLREKIEVTREQYFDQEKAAQTEIDKLVHVFRTGIEKRADHLVTEQLTREFVGRNGALNGNWTKYIDGGWEAKQNSATVQGKLESKLEKRLDARQKAEYEKTHKHGDKDSEFSKIAAGLGAGVVAELVTKFFGGKTLEKYAEPIAIDRILHLGRTLGQGGDDNIPDLVPGIAINKNRNEKDKGYVQYVDSIFQQHQKDSHYTEIGKRYTEHFLQARWDDAAIQQLPDEELTAYEYAIKTIAKRIKDGRLDTIALVDLVGDKHKKIVQSNGRSFGPSGMKDEAAIKEAIRHLVDEKTMLVHAGQKDAPISDKLGNFIFSVADLKHALESNDLDPRERAFLFTVFSDVVGSDVKLCRMLGMSDKRCQELRKESKDVFNVTLDAYVLVLDEMLKNHPEEIDKLKPTEKERKLIVSLAERMEKEGKHVVDLTENREEIKSLETLVANAAMVFDHAVASLGENRKPAGLWANVVKKALSVPEMIAERKKQREQEAAQNKAGAIRDGDSKEGIEKSGDADPLPISARERESNRRDLADSTRELGA